MALTFHRKWLNLLLRSTKLGGRICTTQKRPWSVPHRWMHAHSQAEVRRSLAAEKTALANAHLQRFPKQKIKLDVGGHTFSTTIATLLSVPGTLLASMFRC